MYLQRLSNAENENSESGVIAILIVFVLAALITTIVALAVSQDIIQSHQAIQERQQTFLRSAQKKISQWYLENAKYIDAGGAGSSLPTGLNGPQILADAGVPDKWNVQLLISPEQCVPASQGEICYHTLWVAIPQMGGSAPTVSGSSQTLIPNGAFYETISGEKIETGLYNQSFKQLTSISAYLTSIFYSYQSYGTLHNTNVDYFIPQGCMGSDAGGGPFQCTEGTMQPIGFFFLNSGFSDGFGGYNAWGLSVDADNSGANESFETTPFTMRVESPLPWGGYLSVIIAEPL